MKITDIKSYVLAPIPSNPWIFVEILTDEGVTGLGECTDYASTPILINAIESIKPLVVGQDPSHIEEIWQRISRNYSTLNIRGFVSHVVSAVDIALWDIRGKVLDVPVYQLIGGPLRASVPLYTHIQDQRGVSIAEAVELTKDVISEGYTAIKTDPFKWQRSLAGEYMGADMVERLSPKAIEEAMMWMTAVRETVGSDYELMVDAHGRFDTASAIAAGRALEAINLIWYEEPVPPESFEALRQVRESTNIPICMGERHFTRYDYVALLENRLVDYIMPDICWTGGISEIKRIASMAEAYYVRVSPHDALGPVSIMSGFHASMTIPNFYRLECIHTWFEDFAKIIRPMFDYHDGAIWPSNRPGLGIELNHDTIDEFQIDPFGNAATSNVVSKPDS